MLINHRDKHSVDGNEFPNPSNAYKVGDRVYLFLDSEEQDGYYSGRITKVYMSKYADDCVIIEYNDIEYVGQSLTE